MPGLLYGAVRMACVALSSAVITFEFPSRLKVTWFKINKSEAELFRGALNHIFVGRHTEEVTARATKLSLWFNKVSV